jgi:hypothetical protein
MLVRTSRVGLRICVAISITLLSAGTVGCASTEVANFCRPARPVASVATSTDPFTHSQPVDRSEATPLQAGSAGPVGDEVWACVHATSEVRGLYALGGNFPCLAAIGEVRNGPHPDARADACPSWLYANEVALFSMRRTLAVRAAGGGDACCYQYRRYVYDAR